LSDHEYVGLVHSAYIFKNILHRNNTVYILVCKNSISMKTRTALRMYSYELIYKIAYFYTLCRLIHEVEPRGAEIKWNYELCITSFTRFRD